MLKLTKGIFIVLVLSLLSYGPLYAQHGQEEEHSEAIEGHGSESHESEEFNAGEFVIEHVSDAYDWHITSWGETHISIPLPVIVYSKHPEFVITSYSIHYTKLYDRRKRESGSPVYTASRGS